MSEYIKIILKIVWGVLIMYWFILGMNNKKKSYQEPIYKRFVFYWLPFFIATYLLGPGEWFGHSLIRENFVPHTDLVGIIGLIFCVAGVVIAIWSRYLLGKNWSASVQKKENHELISTGTYRFVRHPIYTGILLIFLGNAIIVGDYRGLIAVAVILISFWFKLIKEEKWLLEIFGDKYLEYKKETKALIPWLI
jgi:protein-S-isoprenylcysteine O-methyltransferase Ste14